MHILIATHNFNIGGFSSYTINMCKAFRKLGHTTTAIVCGLTGELRHDFYREFDNVQILTIRFEQPLSYARRIASAINIMSPDVIINNTVPFVQAALPFISRNIFVFSVLHSVGEYEIDIGCSNGIYIDSLVAVSDNIAHKINNSFRDKFTIIPVGVHCPDRTRMKTRLDSPLRLMFVGRLAAVKNIPTIFSILDILYSRDIDFSLTIIGDGPDKSNILHLVEQSPYKNKIVMTGSLPPSEVEKKYTYHDVLLLPSIYEGTPHAVLEAMAFGLIPVCSRIAGSTDSIIVDGETGFLCETLNAEQYVTALQNIINSPELYTLVLGKVIKYVRENYAITIIVKKYIDIFNEVTTRRASTTNVERQTKNAEIIPSELLKYFPSKWRLIRHVLVNYCRIIIGKVSLIYKKNAFLLM